MPVGKALEVACRAHACGADFSAPQPTIGAAMLMSMYQASVPAFLRSLSSLSAILDKAEAFAGERKIDQAVLLGYRLAPDMFALTRQVQIATDLAKGCCARLAGVEVPKSADDETTLAALRERIDRTIAFVERFEPEDIDGSEERDLTIPAGSRELRFKGQEYLVSFALPNFYFHVTTAYNILRHCGLPIGKRDFLGMT
jgi:uncharacterized protein